MSILRSEVKRDQGGIGGNHVILHKIRGLKAGEREKKKKRNGVLEGMDSGKVEGEVSEQWKVM